jgi:hypothetical protein
MMILSADNAFHIPLELNMHSVATKHYYWEEFWKMVPKDDAVFTGLDAHSLNDLTRRYLRQQKYIMEKSER